MVAGARWPCPGILTFVTVTAELLEAGSPSQEDPACLLVGVSGVHLENQHLVHLASGCGWRWAVDRTGTLEERTQVLGT